MPSSSNSATHSPPPSSNTTTTTTTLNVHHMNDEQQQSGGLMQSKTFKERRTFEERRRDVIDITKKHPGKIPIVIERASTERHLPLLDKTKFLVPEELTMSQLTAILRKRMMINDSQTFYLIVNRKAVVGTSITLSDVYRSQKDEDGFLYMVYASQEIFG